MMTKTIENIESKLIADCGWAIKQLRLIGSVEAIPHNYDISMKGENAII